MGRAEAHLEGARGLGRRGRGAVPLAILGRALAVGRAGGGLVAAAALAGGAAAPGSPRARLRGRCRPLQAVLQHWQLGGPGLLPALPAQAASDLEQRQLAVLRRARSAAAPAGAAEALRAELALGAVGALGRPDTLQGHGPAS